MRQESWVQGLILSFFICGMGRGVDLHGKILLGIPASDAAACGHTVAPWLVPSTCSSGLRQLCPFLRQSHPVCSGFHAPRCCSVLSDQID